MMKRFCPIFFIFFASVVFVGCLDKTPPIETFVAFGTVENPNKKLTDYFFHLDNDTLLRVVSSDYQNYVPGDGQRLFAEFYVVDDVREESDPVHYNIHLQHVNEMLTKDIFSIAPEFEDSIGNDKVSIESMWIGGDHLNALFYVYLHDQKHLINLIQDKNKIYDEDDRIHLEFRHNSNEDLQWQKTYAYASFDISPLQSFDSDSVNLVVHVKPYHNEEESTFELTYKYKQKTLESVPQRSFFKKLENHILLDEIK